MSFALISVQQFSKKKVQTIYLHLALWTLLHGYTCTTLATLCAQILHGQLLTTYIHTYILPGTYILEHKEL